MRRWTENWTWFVDRLNITADLHGDTFFRVTFEQSVFRDATCSAMLQRPRFYHRYATNSSAPHSQTTCTQLALRGVLCRCHRVRPYYSAVEFVSICKARQHTPQVTQMQSVAAREGALFVPLVGHRVAGAPQQSVPLVE